MKDKHLKELDEEKTITVAGGTSDNGVPSREEMEETIRNRINNKRQFEVPIMRFDPEKLGDE